MKAEKTRIIDIAEELGLSTATVSNVIHGKTNKVSDETVKRVQELLEKRAYFPGRAEILLGQNSSGIVGVVVNDHEKYEKHVLEDAFIAASLNALTREIDRAGYFMMVKVTGDCSEIVRTASMWNMEGLVLIGFCEQDCKKLRESMHIPFVVYDGYFEQTERICNLVIDNFDGGRQAGAYLRRMGHHHVLCIADNYICMDRERIEGCRAGLLEGAETDKAKKDPKQRDCCVDFMQIPMQQRERRRFYEENRKKILQYSAVFAVSDFYAVDLIRALQEQGVCVPDDVSVIGFDGGLWAERAYPGLTTVEQDPAERARLAMEVLQKLRSGNYETMTIKLPVHLAVRTSVAQGAKMHKESCEEDAAQDAKMQEKGDGAGTAPDAMMRAEICEADAEKKNRTGGGMRGKAGNI